MSEKIEMSLNVYVLQDKKAVGEVARQFEIKFNNDEQIWEYTYYTGEENMYIIRESEDYWKLLKKYIEDVKDFLYLLERRVEYETRSNSNNKRASTDRA